MGVIAHVAAVDLEEHVGAAAAEEVAESLSTAVTIPEVRNKMR